MQPAKYITDVDFADEFALISDLVTNAESLLQSLEKAESLVGLHCSESKTEFISTSPNCSLRSSAGTNITQVKDFKYLGSYTMESEKEYKVWHGQRATSSTRYGI